MNSSEPKNIGGLVVSEDVIAKIAAVAAREVDGVAEINPAPPELKKLFRRDRETKAVRVNMDNNTISIDVYITIRAGFRIPDVCEAVQKAVKLEVQGMLGRAVTRVNVSVEDVALDDASGENAAV